MLCISSVQHLWENVAENHRLSFIVLQSEEQSYKFNLVHCDLNAPPARLLLTTAMKLET